jgi:serine/threonine-protein kinase
MLQVCEVLAEAHALGIVHRDLKPGNLFVTTRADGTAAIKVLDFGISKMMEGGATSEPQAALTATDTVLGSPIYMSPEQMTTPKAVESRADIWSFGATLYMLLTAKPPFDGDSIAQVCGMILLGKAPSLLEIRADAPPELAAIVTKCLQRNIEDRWRNVGELAAALAPFAGESGRLSAERAQRVLETTGSLGKHLPASTIAAASAAETSVSITGSVTSTDRAMPKTMVGWANTGEGAIEMPRAKPKWPLYAGGVALVLAVGVGIGSLTGRSDSTATGAPSASALAPSPSALASASPPASATVVSAVASAAPSASTAVSAAPVAKAKGGKAPPPPPPAVTAKKKPTGDLFDDRL